MALKEAVAPNVTPGYRTIKKFVVDGDKAYVTFADQDEVSIKTDRLVPPGSENVRWTEATLGERGRYVTVPAWPESVDISWDVIRRLDDAQFAAEMAKLAAEQATHIGERLRGLRLHRQLTQDEVARRADIQPANLSRIENGHFDVASSTLWKLLAVMGCGPADLAGDKK
jgi:hypothetical protein